MGWGEFIKNVEFCENCDSIIDNDFYFLSCCYNKNLCKLCISISRQKNICPICNKNTSIIWFILNEHMIW